VDQLSFPGGCQHFCYHAQWSRVCFQALRVTTC
jgi:hypothetical protein